jgi:hypothetical protein
LYTYQVVETMPIVYLGMFHELGVSFSALISAQSGLLQVNSDLCVPNQRAIPMIICTKTSGSWSEGS